jgi:hypothetical protein
MKEHGQIFPNKKKSEINYERITKHIQESADIRGQIEVGQDNATWLIHPEYPKAPIMLLYMTDVHYGNIGTDYKRLNKHFEIVEKTPNTYLIMGGDGIDNFGIKHAHAAIMGDAIPPQVQAQAFMDKLTQFDRRNKLGCVVYGNHEDWMNLAGYDFYQTFMRELQAPVFTKGGILTIDLEGQKYKFGISHKHWGVSKLNITNPAKRGMEFSWPGVDGVLLGDDHQASAEIFSRAGKRLVVIDGGTYKLNDSTGQKWGLGAPGEPGYCLILWPDQRKFEVMDDPETARDFIMCRIDALKKLK